MVHVLMYSRAIYETLNTDTHQGHAIPTIQEFQESWSLPGACLEPPTLVDPRTTGGILVWQMANVISETVGVVCGVLCS